MSRLLYEADHLHHLEDTYQDLIAHGIQDQDLHVVSNQDGKILRHGMNAANAWCRTDIVHSAIRGAIIGGSVGLLLALSMLFSNVSDQYYGVSGFILTLLFCLGFGTWLGGFLGLQRKNYRLRKFFRFVEEGKYLLLIDVSGQQSKDIHRIIHNRHPQLKLLSNDVETPIPLPIMQTSH